MIEAIWLIIVGLLIGGAGYLGYAAKFKGIAIFLGVVMVLGGAFYPGYGIWGDVFEMEAPPAAITGATFSITPTNGSYVSGTATNNNCPQTVADDEKSTVVQIIQDQSDDIFQNNLTSFNFSIKPVAPTGADNTDLVTIYFSVNEGLKYEGEEIFYESSNVRQAVWSIDDSETTSNYEGSHTMLYTDTDWVELRCELDGKGSDTFGETLETVGETVDFVIHFWNNAGWSWDYTVHIICIETAA